MFFSKRMGLGLLLLLLVFALPNAAGLTASATSESLATPAPPLEVTFKGENNLVINAVFYVAPHPPAPTLLLLNFSHRWSDWAPQWRMRGFNVVAIDELIYNTGGFLDAMNKTDLHNIQLVIQQLNENPNVMPHQFAILGGSLMGGYALEGCALSPDCRTAILLSPTDSAIDIPDPMATLGDRPILITASKGEGDIAILAQTYDRQAKGDHLLLLYDWGFHATAMFYAHPELVTTVGDWLVKYLPGTIQTF